MPAGIETLVYQRNKTDTAMVTTEYISNVSEPLNPPAQDAHWKYIRRPDSLGVFWMSYVRSLCVLCPGGETSCKRYNWIIICLSWPTAIPANVRKNKRAI